ncbi:dolichyl-diphosphooligosaccharide--protein glycosyltransferase subunit 2 [Neltuma alba]|uniref:dolichyl-diphosphooligosaccharide--protein glycosyltransferase subunit 2 n=1 Tax=Neltuma alba TaxID=207710 RepID=UPI0010A36382|nr:dolichyl-diphosphooligosaccharide--protein glycosyltransferase subunit 2 [Prosopis alba]
MNEGIRRGMARSLGGFLALFLALSICQAATNFEPISDSHRSAALELFTPIDGSFSSLEDAYEALRVFEILAIEKKPDVSTTTCQKVLGNFGSSSPLKDLFYALKVNSLLKCGVNEEVFKDIASRVKATINDASTLLDLYYSIGNLILIKDHAPNADVLLADADGTFRSIKALSLSDGRWRYSSTNPEPSTYAAGLALEALAGVVSLASSDIDHSRINAVKNDILKLFDRIEYYDDGTFYFDEKIVGIGEQLDSLSTTASVVRGLTAFAAAIPGKINLPEDKILGLAKFFLGIGIPADAKVFFNQAESLAFLESNRVSIPLILSLPTTVYSLTQKEQLKVRVKTVLGGAGPPLTVKLVRASSSGSKGAAVFKSKELQYDPTSGLHVLDIFSENVDVGTYGFVFEMVLEDLDRRSDYATGGQTHVPIYITGVIKIANAEIAVLDSDLGSIETQKTLDLTGNGVVSLSANHLAKLRLSFQLMTSHGHAFKPQQAFLKLRHETNVEHIFVVGSTGEKFEIVLDFLGLVEKLYYLSGRYDIELTIGDAVMENSFLRFLGHIELDLPVVPEKAARPPPPPVDPYSRYGPKAEITHLFRAPEKRPPQNVSLTFLSLTLLPFVGFLIGLLRLGVNLKNFPSATVPATYAALFHAGIAAVLLLYLLFWLKEPRAVDKHLLNDKEDGS